MLTNIRYSPILRELVYVQFRLKINYYLVKLAIGLLDVIVYSSPDALSESKIFFIP